MTPAQQAMVEVWEQHLAAEFDLHDTEAALATMTDNPHVIHGATPAALGVGREGVKDFYSRHFLPQIPSDVEITPITRTVGSDRIADELIIKFTHTSEMDWILPGVPPTGKQVQIPMVAIITFQDGKVANEHVYWDQASILVQIGLLDPSALPVVGVEGAQKVLELNQRST